MIRTRIAPSPTGYLHIGNARTALFNYLFAKKYHGEVLLRVEDTDTERSKPEFESDIIAGLHWLGLRWDGDIVRQSRLTDRYRSHLKNLIEEGKAGWCDAAREISGGSREVHHCVNHGGFNKEEKGIVRFKTPDKSPDTEGRIEFNDIIHGKIVVPLDSIEDFPIAKNLEAPLMNFAVVVDDHEMEITHVIRGGDHISNTPKQRLLRKALGFNSPIEYAHLPLILAPDRSKLSKRHGAVSVSEYKSEGYLPEALMNFMALLGWHPQDEREIFDLDDLIKEFDLARVQKAGAVFDLAKLNSLNNHYIQNLVPAELARHLKPHLEEFNPNEDLSIKIAHLFQSRLNKFSEVRELARFIFDLPEYPAKMLVWKEAGAETTKKHLETALMVLEKLSAESFDIDSTTTEVMPLANKLGRGEMLWPLRVALTGLEKSPGPFELMEALGREESLKRIKNGIAKLNPQ